MATANKSAIIPIKTTHGGPPLQRTYPEAASQSFKKGELVYLDGSGNVAEFASGIDSGSQRFLGPAAEDAHNDSVAATHNVGVYCGPENIYEGNVTATGADQVTAKTQVGVLYPMYPSTALSLHMVDILDPGSKIDCARITAISSRGAAGDTNGRVEFSFIDAALQGFGS